MCPTYTRRGLTLMNYSPSLLHRISPFQARTSEARAPNSKAERRRHKILAIKKAAFQVTETRGETAWEMNRPYVALMCVCVCVCVVRPRVVRLIHTSPYLSLSHFLSLSLAHSLSLSLSHTHTLAHALPPPPSPSPPPPLPPPPDLRVHPHRRLYRPRRMRRRARHPGTHLHAHHIRHPSPRHHRSRRRVLRPRRRIRIDGTKLMTNEMF